MHQVLQNPDRRSWLASFCAVFGGLALGPVTLPPSLFGKSAVLFALGPIAAVAILTTSWAWGLWPTGRKVRYSIQTTLALAAVFGGFLVGAARALPPPTAVLAGVYWFMWLLLFCWSWGALPPWKGRGWIVDTAFAVGRSTFLLTLALSAPIAAIVLLPSLFPHIFVAGQDEVYRFTMWPNRPPSWFTIFLFAALHLYVFAAAALVAWRAALRSWNAALVVEPETGESTPPTPPVSSRAAVWRRVAVGCAAFYVAAATLHVFRHGPGWQSLLWPAGGVVAQAEDAAAIWAPYDQSKPWKVSNWYLVPDSWKAEILLASDSTDSKQAIALRPDCARRAQDVQNSPAACPPVRRVTVHIWGGDTAPSIRTAPTGGLRCRRSAAYGLTACWSEQSQVPNRIDTSTYDYTAEFLSTPRFGRWGRMDPTEQTSLEAASHFFVGEGAEADFLAQCHEGICVWIFRDGRATVEVEFDETRLSTWQPIRDGVIASLREFKQNAASFDTGSVAWATGE